MFLCTRSSSPPISLLDMDWLFPFSCSPAEKSGACVTHGSCRLCVEQLHHRPCGQSLLQSIRSRRSSHPVPQGVVLPRMRSPRFQRRSSQSMVPPADGILAMATQVKADLLVMGTSCNRGVDKWLHGSVAEQVLRSSSIPVITVGPRARYIAASGRPIKVHPLRHEPAGWIHRRRESGRHSQVDVRVSLRPSNAVARARSPASGHTLRGAELPGARGTAALVTAGGGPA